MRRGCGQPGDAPATAASPSVTLPVTGSASPITATDTDGATAQYGPAKIFSGQYPNAANDPTQSLPSPPSGPLRVSTQGVLGPNGFVTSTANVDPGTQGTVDPNQPRGVGPGPVIADAVRSTCTARETNPATGAKTLTGSTTITNGILETKYDPMTQLPTQTEAVPTNPPANYTRSGTIDHVGDSFSVVYNEQILSPDGNTLTVNAIHMRLLGPTAVGDMVVGQVVCGITTVGATPTPGPAVVSGSTWYTDGSKTKSGPAGSQIQAYAVAALQNVPYRLVLGTGPADRACSTIVAVLNQATLIVGPNGLLGRTTGAVPPGLAPGTYKLCFEDSSTGNFTGTGGATFTVQ
jgi:hypothetical protein